MTLFVSCMYEAMYFLTDKDLEWMASYEQGDTVLFLSSNEIDTMTIDGQRSHCIMMIIHGGRMRALLPLWGTAPLIIQLGITTS